MSLPPSSQQQVQLTADDALLSKLSCSILKYFPDPYLPFFASKPVKRSPLIHRGYYSRTKAITQLVEEFAGTAWKVSREAKESEKESSEKESSEKESKSIKEVKCNPIESSEWKQQKQIIVLGAGFDTMMMRLKTNEKFANESILYIEVDYPEVVAQKKEVIMKHAEMKRFIVPMDPASKKIPGFVNQNIHYQILSCDIRNVNELQSHLEHAGVDFSVPTLVLSECVLVYIDPAVSDKIIAWVSKTFFGGAAFAIYEQIRPDDAFGKVMIAHLEARGCPLLGLRGHPTLESQCARFLKQGWTAARALDMNDVYHLYLDQNDVKRIEKLEIWDEFEEWNMIQAHYCIVVGVLGECMQSFEFVAMNIEERRAQYRDSTRVHIPLKFK